MPDLDAFKLPDFALSWQLDRTGRSGSPNAEKPCTTRYPRTIVTGLLLLLRPSCTPVPGKNIQVHTDHTSGKLVTDRLRAVVELDRVYAANQARFATGTG